MQFSSWSSGSQLSRDSVFDLEHSAFQPTFLDQNDFEISHPLALTSLPEFSHPVSQEIAQATPSPTPAPQEIDVKTIEVTGSTILTPEQIKPIVSPLEGRRVTLEELRQAADRLTQIYLDQGYINSRAILVDQVVTDGQVQIRVIEGRLEDIRIEGSGRLNPNYIRSRVRLGAGVPLNSGALEDQLRLLRLDPLFSNVEASLRAGSDIDRSILIVRVTLANAFQSRLFVDNFSPPSVGSVRFGGAAQYRNVSGLGDELVASYYRTTTGGVNSLDFGYRLPVNAMNGEIQLRVAPNWNNITQASFQDLDITGNNQLYQVTFRQPLIRNPRQEFALSAGFTYQNGQTFLFNQGFPFGVGPDEDGSSRTSVFNIAADYLRRDVGGAWVLRSQLNFGTGLLGATTNSHPTPDSRFVSFVGQVQRVQRLGESHLVIVQADLQLTPDSLLPSQQFVIGGGQSVRGYRQNARSGDNGFRISVEDRIALVRDASGNPTFQLAPFVDLGQVWNHPDNPNELPDQNFLAGVGLGLLWEPIRGLNIRLDYGYPILDLSDRGNDAQDRGFYFSVNWQL